MYVYMCVCVCVCVSDDLNSMCLLKCLSAMDIKSLNGTS